MSHPSPGRRPAANSVGRWFARRGVFDGLFALAEQAARRRGVPRFGLDPLEAREAASEALGSLGAPIFGGMGVLTPGFGNAQRGGPGPAESTPTDRPGESAVAAGGGPWVGGVGPGAAAGTGAPGGASGGRRPGELPDAPAASGGLSPGSVGGVSPAASGGESLPSGSSPSVLPAAPPAGVVEDPPAAGLPNFGNDPSAPAPSGGSPNDRPSVEGEDLVPDAAKPAAGTAPTVEAAGLSPDALAPASRGGPAATLGASLVTAAAPRDVIEIGDLLAGGLTGWEVFEHGGAAGDKGTAAVVNGDLVLAERTSFLVGARRAVRLGANPGVVRFSYQPVSFEGSTATGPRDAFEASLVDAAGRSLVPTHAPEGRDSYLNVTERVGLDGAGADAPAAAGTEAARLGSAATEAAGAGGWRTVTLDVSALAPDTSATVVLRLVNPDPDAGTSVRIRGTQAPVTVALTGADATLEGAGYALGLSAGNLNQTPVDRWEVNWGDGTAATLPGSATVARHAFADDKSYPVTAVAVTTAGARVAATQSVVAANAAPAVSPAADRAVAVGQELALDLATFTDAGFTRASAGTVESFAATVDWGDGTGAQPAAVRLTSAGGEASAGVVTGSHTYAARGAFAVRVTVTDDDRGADTRTFRVAATDAGPGPDLTDAPDIAGTEGTPVAFAASFVNLAPAAAHAATISWGDGSTSAGTVTFANGVGTVSGSHTYADDKSYSVAVTVTDGVNTPAGRTATAAIANAPPAVSAAGPQRGTAGDPLGVRAGTFADAGFTRASAGTVESFAATVDWGDGTGAQPAEVRLTSPGGVASAGEVVGSHTYLAAGDYTATVRVIDDDGGAGGATFPVTVAAAPLPPPPPPPPSPPDTSEPFRPVASGPAEIDEGSVYTLSLAANRSVEQWRVTWGDGSPAEVVAGATAQLTHAYADGPASAEVRVEAVAGGVTTPAAPLSVAVRNVAPAATLDEPAAVAATGRLLPGPRLGLYRVPGTAGGVPVRYDLSVSGRSSDYRSELGYFEADAEGRVGGLAPGEPGYAAAVGAAARTLAGRAMGAGAARAVELSAGAVVGFYAVKDATLAGWRAGNPSNALAGDAAAQFRAAHLWLSVAEGNPDGYAHFREADAGWQLEDLVGGGDEDFNDLTFRLDPAAPPAPAVHAVAGRPVALTARFTDPGRADTHAATFAWFDGTAPSAGTVAQSAGTATADHTFAAAGEYPVAVTVRDDDGGEATVRVVVRVAAPPAPDGMVAGDVTFRAADGDTLYRSEAGYYLADADGRVGGLAPADPGYLAAVMASADRVTLVGQGDALGGAARRIAVPAGKTAGFYLVADGSGAGWTPGGPTPVWLSAPAANADGYRHFLADAAGGMWRVEDLPGGGDAGHDDLRFTLEPAAGPPKFFVADPAADALFGYDAGGAAVRTRLSAEGDADSRGVAAAPDGARLWTIDSARAVRVYDPNGPVLGSWAPTDVVRPEDLATDGTDLWLLDAGAGRVRRYAGAAARLDGTLAESDGFALSAENRAPTGLATRGGRVWVSDDAADAVFIYGPAGELLGQFALDPRNAAGSGLTVDPQGGPDLWAVDRDDATVYRYADGAERLSGATPAADSFALAAGNARPEGIADPPPPSLAVDPLPPDAGLRVGDAALVSGTALAPGGGVVSVRVGAAAAAVDAGGRFFAPVTVGGGGTTLAVTATAADADGPSADATASVTLPARQPDRGRYDFGGLADVTPAVLPTYGRTSFDLRTDALRLDITATHVGAAAVRAPLLMAAHRLTDASVGVDDAAGRTPNDAAVPGAAFADLSAAVPGPTLDPGESAAASLTFAVPNRSRFGYALAFLAAANRPPRVVSVPRGEAVRGTTYAYPSAAVDPDAGDELRYRIVRGPDGLAADPATGRVTWAVPAGADAVGYEVVVEATDALGRSATQRYTLSVRESTANRPPRFVSTPAESAFAGADYSSPSDAFDPDGDRVRYSLTSAVTADGAAVVGPAIDPASGLVSWPRVPAALVGRLVWLTLRAEDLADDGTPRGSDDLLRHPVRVLAQPGNAPPVIVSEPRRTFVLGVPAGTATGAVSPERLTLALPAGGTATRTVTVALPPGTQNRSTSDFVLVMDESASMRTEQGWAKELIPALDAQLRAAGFTNNRFAVAGFGYVMPGIPGDLDNPGTPPVDMSQRLFSALDAPVTLDLFGPDDRLVGSRTLPLTQITTVLAEFRLPADGGYTVVVRDPQRGQFEAGRAEYRYGFTADRAPAPVSKTIALDAPVTGRIAAAGEEHRYAVTLSTAARLYFDLLTDPGYQDNRRVQAPGAIEDTHTLTWSLAGPNGVVVADRPLSASDGDDVADGAVALSVPAGAYTLTVEGEAALNYSGPNGSRPELGHYAFRLLDLGTTPAAALPTGQVVAGTLTNPRQTDVYRFDAAAGDALAFVGRTLAETDWRGDPLPTSAVWRLLDPFGRVVFRQRIDSGTVGGFDPYEGELPGTGFGPVTLAAGGTYTLLVEGDRDGREAWNYDAPLRYTVLAQPRAVTARPLALDALTAGALAPAGVDRYTFTLPARTQALFDARVGGANARWTLTGPDGVVAADRPFNSGPYGGGEADRLLDLPAGAYTLDVSGVGPWAGDYAFRLADLATAPVPLASGVATAGTLSPNAVALYGFTAVRGDRVTFTPASPPGFARWRLVDRLGATLFDASPFAGPQANVPLLAGGRYALLVTAGDYGPAGPADFAFTATAAGYVPPPTPAGATLTLGATASAAVSAADPTPGYTFALAADARLYLDLLDAAYGLRWSLSGPGGPVAGDTLGGSGYGSGGGRYLPLPAGEYQFTVSAEAWNPAGGAFAFRLLDVAAAATTAAPHAPVALTLTPGRGAVAVGYDGAASEQLTVALTAAGGFGTPAWHLVSPGGRLIASSDSGEGVESGGVVTLPAGGRYTVVVDGPDSASATDPLAATLTLHPRQVVTAPLTLGALTDGVVATPTAARHYTVTVPVATRLAFDGLGAAAGLRWTLTRPDGGVTPEAGFDGDAALVAPAGVYTLNVRAAFGRPDTGAFRFRLLDLGAAPSAPLGTDFGGTLTPGDGLAAYRFAAAAGDRFAFTSGAWGGSYGGSWRLVGPDGTERYLGSLGSNPGAVTLDRAGEYALLVTGRPEDAGRPFTVRVTPPATTAFALGLNAPVAGTLANPAARHAYTFAGTLGQTLLFDGRAGAANARARLVGPAGAEVFSQALGGNSGGDFGPFRVGLPGTYTLTLDVAEGGGGYDPYGAGGNGSGTYAFALLDLATAGTVVTPGFAAAGALSASGELGVWRLGVPAGGGRFAFDALAWDSGTGGAGRWRLIDPFGGTVFEAAATADQPGRDLGPGAYTLVVSNAAFDARPATYSFAATPAGTASPAGAATPLPLGADVTGSLSAAAPSADYAFTAARGRRVLFDAIDLTPDQPGVGVPPPTVTLFGPGGAVLWRGSLTLSSGGFYYDEDYAGAPAPVTLLDGGRYRLRVEYPAGGATPAARFTFRLHDLGAAAELPFGASVTGSLSETRGQVYRFTGAAGDRVVLRSDAWGTADQFAATAGRLQSFNGGGTEDGQFAVLNALENLRFRPEAVKTVLLVSDENRDRRFPGVTTQLLLDRLREAGADLHTVVKQVFAVDGRPDALGATGTGPTDLAFYANPDGTYRTAAAAGLSVLPDPNDFGVAGVNDGADPHRPGDHRNGSTAADYAAPAFALGGASWDLRQLRGGGPAAAAFRAAFVDAIRGSVLDRAGVTLVASDPAAAFEIVERRDAGDRVTFTVRFTGDGEARAFDLLAVNRANADAALGSVPVAVQVGYAYGARAIDPDGDPVTFALVGEAHGAAIDAATGRLDWSPPAAGAYPFTVRAADGKGGTDEQTFTVTVAETNAGNRPPTLAAVPPQRYEAERGYALTLAGADPDGDALTYRLVDDAAGGFPLPAGVALDAASGRLTWTPTRAQAGPHAFKAQVADGRGGRAEVVVTVEVALPTPADPNAPPRFTSTPVRQAPAGQRYAYAAAAADPDGDALAFDLPVAPAGLAIDPVAGAIAWTPTRAQAGREHQVVVRVRDGRGGVDLQIFGVTVAAANDPPQVFSTPPRPAYPGQPYRYEVVARDPDGDKLAYSLVDPLPGVAIDPATGAFAWTPRADQLGDRPVTVRIDDGHGHAVDHRFVLPVVAPNRPPTIDSRPTGPAAEGVTYSYAALASDPDGDPVTARFVEYPAWLSAAGATLSGTPGAADVTAAGQPGGRVVLRAEDNRGGWRTQTFDLAVVARPNRAPYFTTTPPSGPTLAGGDDDFFGLAYKYAVGAADPDPGDAATVTVPELPGWLTFDAATSTLASAPFARPPAGDYPVTVVATDRRGLSVSERFVIAVPPPEQPPAPNRPPDFTTRLTEAAVVGREYAHAPAATDPDGDAVTITAVALPAGAGFAGGLFRWTPTAPTPPEQKGELVTFKATDARGAWRTESYLVPAVAVVSASTNRPPQWTNRPPLDPIRGYLTAPPGEGDEFAYAVGVADPDAGDVVTLDVLAKPDWLAYDPAAKAFTGYAPYRPAGGNEYTVRIRATDQGGLWAERTFGVAVVAPATPPAPNSPPYWTGDPTGPAVVGQEYAFTPTASDPDDDAVTITLETALPTGASFAGGTFLWTPPTPADPGPLLTFKATDARGAWRTRSFNLPAVAGAVPNRAPGFVSGPGQLALVGQPYAASVRAADPDGDPVAVTVVGALPAWLTLSPVPGAPGAYALAGTPAAGDVGPVEVRLRAADGRGGATEEAFPLRVVQPNRPPVVTFDLPQGVRAGDTYRGRITATDPDGDPVTFTKLVNPTALAVGADGAVSWATADADAAADPYRFVYRVSDGQGHDSDLTFFVGVSRALPANRPPRVTSPTPTAAVLGEELVFTPTATDPDGDPLSWAAEGLPGGAVVDPVSGTLRWTPTAAQLGASAFTLSVFDGRGGADVAPVAITVRAANRPPRFTSDPPTEARANRALAYTPTAVDPDGGPVTLRLVSGPRANDPARPEWDLRLDGGVLRWTPPPGTVGTFDALLEATDAGGLTDTQAVRLAVSDANRGPSFAQVNGRMAVAGLRYTIALLATDPDGDAVTYALDQSASYLDPEGGGPRLGGAQLNAVALDPATGLLTWVTPPAAGTAKFRVFATDGDLVRPAWLTVPVRPANRAPVVTPQTAPGGVTAGQRFADDVRAADPDGDPLVFSFAVVDKDRGDAPAAPAGLTLDDQGRVRWDTAGVAVGRYGVRVTAADPFDGSDTEEFVIDVRADRTDPSVALTAGPDPVRTGRTLRVTVAASDDVGVAGRRLFVTRPGQAEVEVTLTAAGTAQVTAGADAGDLRLRAAATDVNGRTGAATRTVRVLPAGSGAAAPQVALDGPPGTAAGTLTLTGQADDPDDDLVSWQLDLQRDGTWSRLAGGSAPVAGDLGAIGLGTLPDGRYAVRLTGRDPERAAEATGSVTVVNGRGWLNDPDGGRPPVASIAASAVLGGAVTVRGAARDQDAPDRLRLWTLEAAPQGTANWRTLGDGTAAVDGVLAARPLAEFAPGRYALRLSAHDGTGSAQAAGTLTVFPDGVTWRVNPPVNRAPTAELVKPPAGQVLGGGVALRGTADDPDAADALTWALEYSRAGSFDGTWVRLASGTDRRVAADLGDFATAGLADGLYEVRLSVTDGAGLTARDRLDLFVGDGRAWVPVTPAPDAGRPAATITAPAGGSNLGEDAVHVRGEVTDGGGTVLGWRLDISTQGGGWRRLAGGDRAVIDSKLAVLEPTAMADGTYRLRLTAYDQYGSPGADEVTVTVAGGRAKLGQYGVSFVDLQIPVSGIPISIGRTYDSFMAERAGDFGYGWRMDVLTAKSRLDYGPEGRAYGFREGVARVVVTEPDGTESGFTFRGRGGSGAYGNFVDWRPGFVPDPGVTSRLFADPALLLKTNVGGADYYTSPESGDFYDPADPQFGGVLTLVTLDHLEHTLDARTGRLRSVNDRNGNTLEVRPNGIFSNRGRSVTWEREMGRVTRITDPRGNSIRYGYDASGDLTSVTDRAGSVVSYSYYPDQPHYLKAITDPYGRAVIRVQYDTTGRLKGLTDAHGYTTEASYGAPLSQSTADAEGNTSTVQIDARGNVVRSVDAAQRVTLASYDASDRVTREVVVLGGAVDPPGGPADDLVTTYDYGRDGRLRGTTNPSGRTNALTYNDAGDITTLVDETGIAVSFAYTDLGKYPDGSPKGGDLIAQTGADGVTTSYDRDAAGNLTGIRKGSGFGKFTYSVEGDLASTVDQAGFTQVFETDANGNQTASGYTWTNPADPADKRPVVTTTVYDFEDRPIRTESPEGGETSAYDKLGSPLGGTNPAGQSKAVVDARGNVIRVENPDGTSSDTVYDPLGRAAWQTLPHAAGQATNGTLTLFDALGREVAQEHYGNVVVELLAQPDGSLKSAFVSKDAGYRWRTETQYNEDGTVKQATTADGLTTSFRYDRELRPTETVTVTDGLTIRTRTAYDDAGRVSWQQDARGGVTTFVRDDAGRPAEVRHADGTVTKSTYTWRGNVETATDQLGRVTRYAYTDQGDLAAVTQPEVFDALAQKNVSPTFRYGYDQYRNLVSITDPNGHTQRMAYDQHRRQTEFTLPATAADPAVTARKTYDAIGRLATSTDFNGQVTAYTYDARSRPESAKYYASAAAYQAGTPTEAVAYAYDIYDASGRHERVTDQYGVTDRVYDVEGWLLRVSAPGGRSSTRTRSRAAASAGCAPTSPTSATPTTPAAAWRR